MSKTGLGIVLSKLFASFKFRSWTLKHFALLMLSLKREPSPLLRGFSCYGPYPICTRERVIWKSKWFSSNLGYLIDQSLNLGYCCFNFRWMPRLWFFSIFLFIVWLIDIDKNFNFVKCGRRSNNHSQGKIMVIRNSKQTPNEM